MKSDWLAAILSINTDQPKECSFFFVQALETINNMYTQIFTMLEHIKLHVRNDAYL